MPRLIGTLDSSDSRDRLVVRTLRCGRSNPGSNPGHGSADALSRRRSFLWRNGSGHRPTSKESLFSELSNDANTGADEFANSERVRSEVEKFSKVTSAAPSGSSLIDPGSWRDEMKLSSRSRRDVI
ncbi:hypothetical protein EVAR_68859_1 [Eumeta japonica]|uniref:Uncharacterized protein n=1 Tax=Eumeta variegata TaxID=151549 RepID=A0A4C1ZBQ6_EUMVA|nr:hypothetical protein EVAR_68859_1 [Eumeta japonica]